MAARILALVLVAALGACAPTPSAPPAGRSEAHAGLEEATPARLLRVWDERRAAAYSSGDAAALRALYARRSEAGRRDLALLDRYLRRGLVVTGMRTQVLDLRVVRADPTRLLLVVTDRVVGASAHGRGRTVRLPAGAPRSRRVSLVRDDGRWLVQEVRRVRR